MCNFSNILIIYETFEHLLVCNYRKLTIELLIKLSSIVVPKAREVHGHTVFIDTTVKLKRKPNRKYNLMAIKEYI